MSKSLTELAKESSPIDHVAKLRSADATIARLKAELGLAEEKRKRAEQELENANKRVDLLAALSKRKPAKARAKVKRTKSADGTALVVLSDWHVEEPVDPETVNGVNEFSLEIADKRIKRTFDKALMLLEDARHLTEIRECVVAALGDFITGDIHDELKESALLHPLPACRWASERIESGLKTLLEHGELDKITVVTARGNHGRTTPKKRHATSYVTSYEHNMYLELQQRFSGEPRIEWNIGKGYLSWEEIQGYPVRFHHGDEIKYQGGVGGITIPVNKAIAQWDKTRQAYLDVFGHWHQFKIDGKWISNGSLIGHSAHAVAIKAEPQAPVQAFAVIDRQRGLTRCIPVFCE
jgi:hypothetical protein